MEILAILLIAVLIFLLVRLYVKHTLKKVETITAYTGGLGSGKSLLSVDDLFKRYNKSMRKWRKDKIKAWLKGVPFNQEKPQVYTSIPICLNQKKKIYSKELTNDILLLQTSIPLYSVCLIDEVGSYASQFDYNNINIKSGAFEEFCRLYRHYTKGGYLIVNDQCSENIVLNIRRRLNVVHNLSNCVVIWRFAFYFERNINISEEIKTIDQSNQDKQQDTQDNMRLKVRFLLHKKSYDSYCYYKRYLRLERNVDTTYNGLSKLDLLAIPSDKKYNQKTNEKGEKEQ